MERKARNRRGGDGAEDRIREIRGALLDRIAGGIARDEFPWQVGASRTGR